MGVAKTDTRLAQNCDGYGERSEHASPTPHATECSSYSSCQTWADPVHHKHARMRIEGGEGGYRRLSLNSRGHTIPACPRAIPA